MFRLTFAETTSGKLSAEDFMTQWRFLIVFLLINCGVIELVSRPFIFRVACARAMGEVLWNVRM